MDNTTGLIEITERCSTTKKLQHRRSHIVTSSRRKYRRVVRQQKNYNTDDRTLSLHLAGNTGASCNHSVCLTFSFRNLNKQTPSLLSLQQTTHVSNIFYVSLCLLINLKSLKRHKNIFQYIRYTIRSDN